MKEFIKSLLPYEVVSKLQKQILITEPEPVELFNSEGDRVNVFYLQDVLCRSALFLSFRKDTSYCILG